MGITGVETVPLLVATGTTGVVTGTTGAAPCPRLLPGIPLPTGTGEMGFEIFDGGITTRLDSVPYSVVVNKNGDRFYDEGEDVWPKRYAIWGRLIAQQPDQIRGRRAVAHPVGHHQPVHVGGEPGEDFRRDQRESFADQ